MPTFQKVKIKDIANEDRDAYLPSAAEDIPYIGLEHIEQQTLRLTGIGKSSDATSQKKKFVVGDVLYGSLRPYFRKVYKPNFDGVCSTDITVIKPKSNCSNSYLFYLIASPEFISKASGAGTGTKMPRAGWKVVKDFMFDVPDLPTQTRIASVLSAYDDLIENNEKRIKALEQMAQLLYTEWFVKYDFPTPSRHPERSEGSQSLGYKSSGGKMVDSGTEYGLIPEGWEVGKISELANVISGFPFKGSTYQESGKYKIVTIKNVHDGKFVLNFDSFIDELPSKLPKTCVLNRGDVLLSLTGNVGRICIVYGVDHLLNQRVAKLSPVEKNKREYIYLLFRQKRFQQKLEAMSNGSAQQNLSPIQVKDIKVLIPSPEILDKFSQLVANYFDLSLSLREKNQNLSETRDLLIPQLVTGRRVLQ